MSDPATEPATPAAPALTKEADPEIASVKQLLKLLDKTAKSTRTYGFTNSVAQKFFQQLHEGLTGHLTTYHALGFLIQRSELYFREETVYQTESSRDNLAFKLYADGIRELTFHEGLTQEDLTFFLSALWDGEEPGEEDDDIVTRLWAKNMTSITIITAEEIVKASGAGDVLTLQTDGTMNEPTSSLREMVAQEKTRATAGGAGSGAQSRFQSGSIGYEVSEAEQSALAKVVEEESSRDNTMYVLDMLTAILASEQSPALLTKLFDVFGGVLEVLTQQGNWTVLEHVLSLLHETEAMRPDLSDAHKAQLLALFETLRRPERIKLIETYLNNAPTANTQGLLTLLLLMNSQAIQALCALLANLQVPAHQAIVCEVLTTLARETPEPLLRGLSDRRAPYVRNLLSIISKWNNPHLAEAVEKVIRY
ncbi:MAG: hypothetical protein ACT4OO_03915, partial [Nitrospiraceae bacterium]